jgi:hypothetical protein
MANRNHAEVKQYTAQFSFNKNHLTVDNLSAEDGNNLIEMDYNPDTNSYTSDTGKAVILPIGAKIFNGTGVNNRIGNRITLTHLRVKMLMKNEVDYAPVLKVMLIQDNGINSKDNIDNSDIFDGINPGSVIGTIPKLNSNGRYSLLKAAVIETKLDSKNSLSYMSWDLTLASTMVFSVTGDDDSSSGLATVRSGMYILFAVGDDASCSVTGAYSVLYTDS